MLLRLLAISTTLLLMPSIRKFAFTGRLPTLVEADNLKLPNVVDAGPVGLGGVGVGVGAGGVGVGVEPAAGIKKI